MSEDLIIKQCAPTLAGVKTGSIFSCPYDSKEELIKDIRKINKILVPKGLCMCPLHYSDSFCLLYLFRPESLKADFKNDKVTEILEANGYTLLSSEKCLGQLVKRFRNAGSRNDFPHEIGLFLSYPPEDVKGFIENRAENYKCSGMWKVYGNESEAKALFAKYKKYTEDYLKLREKGASLEELTVSI